MMTLNEIFDALRSQGDISYFGIIVQEAFHQKPVVIIHEQSDFAVAEEEFHREYDNDTLANAFNNACIVGYGFGRSRDLKLVELVTVEPKPLQERIAARAKQIYTERQRTRKAGTAASDWAQAEKEIRAKDRTSSA